MKFICNFLRNPFRNSVRYSFRKPVRGFSWGSFTDFSGCFLRNSYENTFREMLERFVLYTSEIFPAVPPETSSEIPQETYSRNSFTDFFRNSFWNSFMNSSWNSSSDPTCIFVTFLEVWSAIPPSVPSVIHLAVPYVLSSKIPAVISPVSRVLGFFSCSSGSIFHRFSFRDF